MKDEKRKVVVTGLGITCAIGNNLEEAKRNLEAGKTGIDKITLFDSEKLTTHMFGEVKDDMVYRERELNKPSRMELIAEKLVKQLLDDSGITEQEIEALDDKAMMSMATSVGSNTHLIEYTSDIAEGAYFPERFANYPKYMMNIFQEKLKLGGQYFINNSACSAGTTAICTAFSKIRSGECDLAVVVGIDPATEFSTYGFNSMKNMNSGVCTPFDKDRTGINIGEGGGIMLLESLEHAKAREAKIYAEVLGYGIGNDAYHRTSPDPTGEGAYRTMQMALKDAEITPDEIDYVNAHGTGTEHNDSMELIAMEKLFSESRNKPVVGSTKDLTGHCLAAAGMVEAVFCVLSINEKKAWGNNHLTNPEVAEMVELLNEPYRLKNVRNVMSNSFAFAGNSSSIVMSEFNG